jgi:hypothetical protein
MRLVLNAVFLELSMQLRTTLKLLGIALNAVALIVQRLILRISSDSRASISRQVILKTSDSNELLPIFLS